MYNSSPGMSLKADISVWKFFARTSLGTCASQSVNKKVESSLKLPSSKTLQEHVLSNLRKHRQRVQAYEQKLSTLRIGASGL
jgi:hypothetical protein